MTTGWLAALTAAGGLLAARWLTRGLPERLADLPRGASVVGVRAERVYLLARRRRSSSVSLVETRVGGGRQRLLAEGLSAGGGSVTPLGVDHAGILLALREERPAVAEEGDASGGPSPRSGSAPSGSPATPDGTRGAVPPSYRTRLLRAPLQGGPPREILAGRETPSAVVVEGRCYWLQPHAGGRGRARGGGGPEALLMESGTGGGPPRPVASGLPLRTTLLRGTRHVFWHVPGTGPDTWDLAHLRTPDGSLGMLSGYNSLDPPVELGEKFYWIRRGRAARRGALREMSILEASHDGLARRTLLRLSAGEESGLSGLQAHGDHLYFFRTGESTRRRHDPPLLFCRLLPEEPARIETLCRVSPQAERRGFFDGGWFYYVASEHRENWLDWSPAGLTGRRVSVLHRVPLRS